MGNQETIQWRSWGTDAFQQAQEANKPIFLSISATWCHWCHVLDEESFTHPEIIRRINADFIPIRVDSDKRPDLNSRYNMGGWPTVAILDPQGELVTGGTYMPPGQLLSMLSTDLLGSSHVSTSPSRSDPTGRAGKTGGSLSTLQISKVDSSIIETIASFLERVFDRNFGGFGGPPKFPQVWAIDLAFHLHSRTGEKKWLEMATFTLNNMREGGLYDLVDGGFFRYSASDDWDSPHYEKLLEVNAQMLSIYLKAYILTGQVTFRATAQGILDYLLSTLTCGGPCGNKEKGPPMPPRPAPALAKPDAGSLAVEGQMWFCGSQSADRDYYDLSEEERVWADTPPLDTTLYTDRNAMAVSALLIAHHVFGDSQYRDRALKLIDFLWEHCYREGQGMFHYYEEPVLGSAQAVGQASPDHGGCGACEDLPKANRSGPTSDAGSGRGGIGEATASHGPPHINTGNLFLGGYLSDQVHMMASLMDAFEATGIRLYLDRAEALSEGMHHHLWDSEDGGYRDLPDSLDSLGALKVRIKPFAENAVASIALTRLFHLTGHEIYLKKSKSVLNYLSMVYGPYKHHAAPFALAMERFLQPPLHVTLVGNREFAQWSELLRAAHLLKSPWKVVLLLDEAKDRERLQSLGYSPSEKPLAYLCIGKLCYPPVSRLEDLKLHP